MLARSDRKIHVYKIAEGSTSPGGGVTPPSDTTPAVLSNGSPTNSLPAGTNQTTMGLTTNENATCRWSTSSNISYASMTNTFTNTGGTTHSTLISSLADGGSYSRYVRCIDSNGVVNTNDYTIRWNVAASPAPSGRRVVNVSTLSGLYAAFYN